MSRARRATFQERMEAVEDMRAVPGAWVRIPTWGDPVTAVQNQRQGRLRYLPPGEFESAVINGVAMARVIPDA